MLKIFAFVILISIISCKNFDKDNRNIRYSIKLAKDTVKVQEPVKAIVYLAAPYFDDKNSKIVVFLELDANQPLKKDLSNYLDIPTVGFHNLENDTTNQKWSSDKLVYDQTSAIGLKFDKLGRNYLRGYILEYYTGDPLLDSIFDYSKTKKHFFQEEIYVEE